MCHRMDIFLWDCFLRDEAEKDGLCICVITSDILNERYRSSIRDDPGLSSRPSGQSILMET